MVKIIDISMEIKPDMTVYKNKKEKRPEIYQTATHAENRVQETEIRMNVHTGTHMDAPLHMIDGGKTIKDTALDLLIAPCRVLDLSFVDSGITAQDLKGKTIEAGDFILLKTKNSSTNDFGDNFVFLEKSGAAYLNEKQIKGVGIDALGIERSQPDHDTHHILLGNDIPIIEGLRFNGVDEGEYTLVALPLKLQNIDGTPMRAVLLPKGSISF